MNATSPQLNVPSRTLTQAEADRLYRLHHSELCKLITELCDREAPQAQRDAIMFALEEMVARQAERIRSR